MLELTIGAIIAALIFDFVNGWNDAANSVATVIGTRVLKPIHAVLLSAVANFVGPFVFGVAVATTIAKGILNPEDVTTYMIIGALAGAISWASLCTHFGLPISVSHSLIGGLIGTGLATVGYEKLLLDGLYKVGIGIIASPMGGLIIGLLFTTIIIIVFANHRPGRVNKIFGRLQIFSATWFALTHGANDGQKTMGIIVLILMSEGILTKFEVPIWVILAAASAISLGTFLGGSKVIKTLGMRMANLRPYQGFAAETGGGVILAIFASLGIPASTTHAITGSIMGTAAAKRKHAVRWNVGKQIIITWLITIPGSAAIAYLATIIINSIV
ncbi:MAG: inorganic phosphate transporter [Nitrosopumilaceae archaeon]